MPTSVDIYRLFLQVSAFLKYPFTVGGFTFSLFNVWAVTSVFYILMNFCARAFGKMEEV